jgi:mRNA interferase MazF
MVALSKVRRGCIYVVDFDPVIGSEQGKKRPALVIQNDLGNLSSDTTIVVAISSRVPTKSYPMHVSLPAGILDKPGVIMCEQIRTVSLQRVQAKALAELPKNLMSQVEEAIHHSLGFSEETAAL